MSKNATYLTQEYPGQEDTLWTPCLYDFFCKFSLELPTYCCINSPSNEGPWYKQDNNIIKTQGFIYSQKEPEDLLDKIGTSYSVDLKKNPSRYKEKGDIAGIKPDIVIIDRQEQGVILMENKPYYHSTFDGNQEPPDGAYIDFVRWLNEENIPTLFAVIHSSSWNTYSQVKQLNDLMGKQYASVMLEDIFWLMSQKNFQYNDISEHWSAYTNKKPDCV